MLTYNGVELAWQLTGAVDQRPVRDPSGTDVTGVEFTFRYSGTVAASALPTAAGESATEAVKRLEHLLRYDRRVLKYVGPDGDTLLEVYPATSEAARPAGAVVDLANGPKVLDCRLTQITEAAYAVSLTISTVVKDCSNAANNVPDQAAPVPLSHRWTEAVKYGPDWLCVRHRRGTLKLPTGVDVDADTLRRSVFSPPPPKGFARISAEYGFSEDGLTATYSFEDKELVRPAPEPAVRMFGRQSETIPLPGGGLRFGQIDLTLVGTKKKHQKELLNAAIRAAMSRVHAAGVIRPRTGLSEKYVIGGAITESLDDDKSQVTLTLQWRMRPSKERDKGASRSELRSYPDPIPPGESDPSSAGAPPTPNAVNLDSSALPGSFGSWVGADVAGVRPDRAIGPPTRGTADTLKLVAAGLNDPCGSSVSLPAELRSRAENQFWETSTESYNFRLYRGPVSPDRLDGGYRDEPQPGVSTVCEVSVSYLATKGVCTLPSTKVGEPSAAVRYHTGNTRLVCEWSAERVGGRPEVPNPEPRDVNFVLESVDIVAQGVRLGSDGVSPLYTASGRFEYGVVDDTRVRQLAPVPPYIDPALFPGTDALAPAVYSDEIVPWSAMASGTSSLIPGPP